MDALPLRYSGKPPRALLLTSAYFLLGELKAACERMGIPHLLLDFAAKQVNAGEFVRAIRETCAAFKPDYILTVNHLGVDHEGVLPQLAREQRLPLVSWFVDNPEFILPLHANPDPENTLILTWDADSLDVVRSYGYRHVGWLPLGADPERFRPPQNGTPARAEWSARVSFVGNSMVVKTLRRLEAAAPTPGLTQAFVSLSEGFGRSGERSVRPYLAAARPDLLPEFDALGVVRSTSYATALVWRSTLEYRLRCVRQTLGSAPLIAGDPGWAGLLGQAGTYRLHPEINYYQELPGFYPASQVNFNATSLQMKGAVNQRVFDVPACGAFLLTDRRRQLEELFEPGVEVALYDAPEEVPELLERYLADAGLRQRIAQAGRKRVLAEHTYVHRMSALMEALRQTFPERIG